MTEKSFSPSRRASADRRAPLAKAVPADVLVKLNRALRELPEPSSDTIAEIHERFELLEKHNVSLRQTINHAKRLRNQPPTEQPSAPTTTSCAPLPVEVETYRRRMNAIGEALSAMFIGMESADSDLWGRGIYLKLIGHLYDVLDSDDLSLGDLQSLSKIISEQRRAQSQALEVERRIRTAVRSDSDEDDDTNTSPRRELPAHFGEMVRQIYGVNLQHESGD